MVVNPNEHIEELSFANVIGDRFGRYSKYIIQDRALPDIRDGLKPVQRRILFAMQQDRNTAENAYRKSAKTVGNVIGNYHPHGDSSVYDAMVRLSQDWKLREPLIDMHGNNGSMDGDPAAAMRYTEARLSPIASTLLADINYETVDYALNFDDTIEEPVVLPARYPNLIVNGATGISAGYATEIPPHNLGEVIDAVIHMLKHKKYTLDDILKYIKGPDFPTGAIIQGAKDLKNAYKKGNGKVLVRAKTDIENLRGGKKQIVATELPYDVNKSKLIQRLDDIRLQKKIDGIAEVRDESDREGVRVVVELRRDVDAEGVLNYLLKNSDLQINYHFNMVAIYNRRPITASLIMILEAYIAHQQEVITRRTKYQLNTDRSRLHIVEGLIRVVSILDEVIATIRDSENKADAKRNLIKAYDFSEDQAEAIVSLQLYRLTNTDVTALQNERLELNERIAMYNNILTKPDTLNKVLINELTEIQKKYSTTRRTEIEAEVEEISIETSLLIPKDDVVVSVTKEGYIKRTSFRSFKASDTENLGRRDFDFAIFVEKLNTHEAVVILTNKGNYIYIPVHELPEIRWNAMGMHISQNYKLLDGESIIAVFKAAEGIEASEETQPEVDDHIVITTRLGMIKQTALKDFVTYRSYKTRTAMAMKLKKDDEVIAAHHVSNRSDVQVILVTHRSYSLRYRLSEVSVYGLKAQGVIGINLRDDDFVVQSLVTDNIDSTQILALTQRGNIKRFESSIAGDAARASRGILIFKELKAQPHRIISVVAVTDEETPINVMGDTGHVSEFVAADVPVSARLTNGSSVFELDKLGQVVSMHKAKLTIIDQRTSDDSADE
ncbi:DNA topoisomerase IV subunit A [Aerococcaceae bacterium WGS1372]